MTVERELERFEQVIGSQWPELFGQLEPGLDDAEMQRLREAVAPYLVPARVEALYRWRGGTRPP